MYFPRRDINQIPPIILCWKRILLCSSKILGQSFAWKKNYSIQVFASFCLPLLAQSQLSFYLFLCQRWIFRGVYIFAQRKGSSSAERKTTLWAKLDLLSIALAIVRAWNIKLHTHRHHRATEYIYIVCSAHTVPVNHKAITHNTLGPKSFAPPNDDGWSVARNKSYIFP